LMDDMITLLSLDRAFSWSIFELRNKAKHDTNERNYNR
jgi:hypothetical protein